MKKQVESMRDSPGIPSVQTKAHTPSLRLRLRLELLPLSLLGSCGCSQRGEAADKRPPQPASSQSTHLAGAACPSQGPWLRSGRGPRWPLLSPAHPALCLSRSEAGNAAAASEHCRRNASLLCSRLQVGRFLPHIGTTWGAVKTAHAQVSPHSSYVRAAGGGAQASVVTKRPR